LQHPLRGVDLAQSFGKDQALSLDYRGGKLIDAEKAFWWSVPASPGVMAAKSAWPSPTSRRGGVPQRAAARSPISTRRHLDLLRHVARHAGHPLAPHQTLTLI
jgi:hypothetical protein